MTTQNNALVEKAATFEVNGEEVKLSSSTVKNFLVSGNGKVSDQEVVMFISLCKYQKLNPFLKEAYLIKFGEQPAQIIVAKEAFMKRAEAHPKFKGIEAGIIVERDGQMIEVEGAIKLSKDKLLGGWCKVYRSDRDKPVTIKIDLAEFGKGQSTWKTMPMNMIRKTAVVNGLREAFPDFLGAMHTEEEISDRPQEEVIVQREVDANANSEVLEIKQTPKAPAAKKAEKEKPVLVQADKETGEIFQNGEPEELNFDQTDSDDDVPF